MKILSTLALALSLTGAATIANAQMPPNTVNCAELSNTQFMCVKNTTGMYVTGIQAVSLTTMFPSPSWIKISGDAIPPGGTTIVRFGTWGNDCYKNVFVQTQNRQTHNFQHVDVCRSTSIVVTPW